MTVSLASSDADILSCYPVMKQLRPKYEPETFLVQVRRQEREGYKLAMLVDANAVVAVAGYRFGHNLAWGHYLYVDDLVTDASMRSNGYGRRLLDWLTGTAQAAGCDELHLDSGVQRFAAHRFYLRSGMDITSHHFRIELCG
jgi:GNAT superfamily N-acetyltransferase